MASTPETAAQQPSRRDLANAVRALSMDAVQAANSGHPGAPMGMADIAEVLWNDFLKHNPANPEWVNRDRFVLSNGHGSMLLYSLLHLTGYPLSIDELRNFRQLGARTAGHPEYEPELGIETTTGPLGQGITNAVGMALAEKMLADRYNKPDLDIVDHRTWVFLGDGCLMEGISHEACSLAGALGLGKLICLYDDNGISIDGDVAGWFADDTPARFRAYGWQVIADVDGHDAAAIHKAIEQAQANSEQPTLICCKTIIGFGSPNKQGTEATHGAPLGTEEIAAAREALGWSWEPFEVPDSIRAGWDGHEAGQRVEQAWDKTMATYREQYPELATEIDRRLAGDLPADWVEKVAAAIAEIGKNEKPLATRKDSQIAINAFASLLPEMTGGSADLTGSNLTNHDASVPVTREDASGDYIYYGVREFAMAAIMNGMTLHGGFIPYGGTFLTFSDYARNALRMAALMKIQNILVFTHDSIGLGEDGPTHQPVEHVESLRIMPNMTVWRPCDGVETAVAWQDAIERRDGPTSLIFSRQSLPRQVRDADQVAAVRRGGYVLYGDADPQAILIATGSEVALVMDAARELQNEGLRVRVVSIPCVELFADQEDDYRDSVLPPSVTCRVAVEAGVGNGWYVYVGSEGSVISMDCFGESAPAPLLFEKFGFTTERVTSTVRELLAAD
ncbi:MAG: transketolase [Gammaproteobacteria bacterium]|nr:transketolase [Gammaproteobacteria bacterium]MCP4088568.1 transketolase [Gammaproteobacteria bacterium]MCP4276524.1 transketolase [Gammaproteobacteria bacterium]MCP4832401.1 transketolase [Gammaproteobacteria bacterium]MCP4929085.1 transketolase [Gammaproteobacteria bacterium]